MRPSMQTGISTKSPKRRDTGLRFASPQPGNDTMSPKRKDTGIRTPSLQPASGTMSPKRRGTGPRSSSMQTGYESRMLTPSMSDPSPRLSSIVASISRKKFSREPSLRDQNKSRDPHGTKFISEMNKKMKYKNNTDLGPPPVNTNRRVRLNNFPALPYAIDSVHFNDRPDAQRNISMEFIDFLDSLRDLLRLTINCKTKFLTSANPLPNDVMREIHYLPKDKTAGERTKAFEKELTRALKSGKNEINPRFVPEAQLSVIKQAVQKASLSKLGTKVIGTDQFWGKKSKAPIWQVVGSRTSGIRVVTDKEIEDQVKATIKKGAHKNSLARASLMKVNQLDESIDLAKTQHIKATNERFQYQMDLLQSYAAGFTSLQKWKFHIKSCRPHWLKDLFRESVDLEVIISEQVYEAFEKFGDFYDYNFLELPFPKAKLCLIMQSLPIWDASRVTIQRAAAFILRNILLSKNADDELTEWLQARQLTNLVEPQISDLGTETETEFELNQYIREVSEKSGSDVPVSQKDTDVRIEKKKKKKKKEEEEDTKITIPNDRGIYKTISDNTGGFRFSVRGESYLDFDRNHNMNHNCSKNSNSLNSKPVLPPIRSKSKKPVWK